MQKNDIDVTSNIVVYILMFMCLILNLNWVKRLKIAQYNNKEIEFFSYL